MTKISIFKKVRAPSRSAFCEGLVSEPELTGSFDPQDSGDHHHRNELHGDKCRGHADAKSFLQVVADERPVVNLLGVVLRTERVFERNERTSEPQHLGNDSGRQHNHVNWFVPLESELQRNTSQQYGHPNPVEHGHCIGQLAVGIHREPPSLWFLSGKEQRPVQLNLTYLDNANIAYMRLKVKHNRKSPYYMAFSGFSYWIKKFSSPKMRNRQFVFTPKIEYELVAERSEANQNSLTFPTWCPGRDSNPQALTAGDFKSPVYTIPPPGQ